MNINYEFHLTIKNADKDTFINFCKINKIKPIILELQNKNNITIFKDIMTSHHKILNNDNEAMIEMNRIKGLLIDNGFNVVRDKIEADINHPDLTEEFNINNSSNYFETHFNILSNNSLKNRLKSIAKNNNCHFSRNIFKKIGDNYTIMLTYRKHLGNIVEFKKDIEDIEKNLIDNDFKIEKLIIEYSIYDSREDWDSKWLTAEEE